MRTAHRALVSCHDNDSHDTNYVIILLPVRRRDPRTAMSAGCTAVPAMSRSMLTPVSWWLAEWL